MVNRKPAWSLIPGDWVTLQRIVNELGYRVLSSDTALWGPSGANTQLLYGGLILPGLSASQAVMTDASKKLVSADYLDQAVKVASSPTFVKTTLTDGTAVSTYYGKALQIDCTLSSATLTNAVLINTTTSNAYDTHQNSLLIRLLAGYTGSSYATNALEFFNYAGGTKNSFATDALYGWRPQGNRGVGGYALGTSGINIGHLGLAINGTMYNFGVVGSATKPVNSTINIGVFGTGRNTGTSPTQIGGYFGLWDANSVPSLVSAALIADNSDATDPIFLARDNGNTVFTIADGGNITSTGTIQASNMISSAAIGIASVIGTSDYAVINLYSSYNPGGAHGCYFVGNRSRGTHDNPTQVGTGDYTFQLQGNGYIDGVYRPTAQIGFWISGTPGVGSYPGMMNFMTVADGSTTMTTRAILTNAGKWGVGFTSEANVLEQIHSSAKVRADTFFNLNGTDGVTQVAGSPSSVTTAGGIVTAVTVNGTPTFAGVTMANRAIPEIRKEVWQPWGLTANTSIAGIDLGNQASATYITSITPLGYGLCIATTGAGGKILRSTDWGATWTATAQQYSQTYLYSSTYCGNGICLVGSAPDGKIIRSTDYGTTWSDLGTQYTSTTIRSLVYLGNGICLAGTDPGHVLRSTDYGVTWTDLGQQYSESSIFVIHYLGGGICLAGTGNLGHILRSTDYGATWSDLGQQYSETGIYNLSYLGNGICLAGTIAHGHILRSTDYGATWSDLGQQGSETYIYSFAYAGNGKCFAGTRPNGHIFYSINYGATWSDLGQQSGLTYLWSMGYLGEGILLVGTASTGHILRYCFGTDPNISKPTFAGLTITSASPPALNLIADGSYFRTQIDVYSDTTGNPPQIFARHAGGTLTTPTKTTLNMSLFDVIASGHNDVSLLTSSRARWTIVAAEDWSSIANGTFHKWTTTPIGSTTPGTQMILSNSGNLGVGLTTDAAVLEKIHSSAKVRADTFFNLNGTDGVTGSFVAGTKTVTVIGGIITAIV